MKKKIAAGCTVLFLVINEISDFIKIVPCTHFINFPGTIRKINRKQLQWCPSPYVCSVTIIFPETRIFNS